MERKKRTKGITLISLVVTVIILLILAGIGIIMITGENGLLREAIQVREKENIEDYREIIELNRGKPEIESGANGIDNKKYMDMYEEELRNEKKLEDASITRVDEGKIRVATKEGYVYYVTKDKIEYIGKQGNGEVPTVNSSNTKVKITPSEWTKGKVRVTIETTENTEGYELQYSIDKGKTWIRYPKEGFEIEDNGVAIYARIINNLEEYNGTASGTVGNIDRLPPTSVSFTEKHTTKSITVTVSATDAEATETNGKSEIGTYYFSKDGGTSWEPKDASGQEVGQTNPEYTFNNLQSGTYKIKVKVKDKAGNEKEMDAVTDVATGTVTGLTDAETKVVMTPSQWTKGKVRVTMTTTANTTGYTKQYSIDKGDTWEPYPEEGFDVTENGTAVYVRLYDGVNGGSYASGTVGNIDRLPPKEFIPKVSAVEPTTLTLEGSTTDAEATSVNGMSGEIKYYFSIDGGTNWEPKDTSGKEIGQTSGTYTFKNLTRETQYSNLKMKAEDKAGNVYITTASISGTTTIETYQITYNTNGGEGGPTSAQTKYYGKTLKLDATKPTKEGYAFQGWATSQENANAGTVEYTAGADYTANAGATLYAVWKTKNMIKEAKELGTKFEENKTLKDEKDNIVKIPGKFHIAKDSGDTVEEGIVIEDDEGNQFVWIPVSNIDGGKDKEGSNDEENLITRNNEEKVEITLRKIRV